jgi:hypothetical protein
LARPPAACPSPDRQVSRPRPRLATIADYFAEHWPIEREIRTVHRRPEQARLYRTFRTSLAWLGAPADTWKLIDELVAVVINSIIARSVEFALDPDELQITSA